MRVSVVMACYNAAPFVHAAVTSVLNQTYDNIELIVVDDGSIDDSLKILRSFRHPKMKILMQSNAGQCSACNHGYRESTGDYIKFFDADDILDREMIERQVSRLSGRTDAIAMGEWRRFFGSSPEETEFARLAMYRDAAPIDWLVQEWSSAEPMMQCALWLTPRSIVAAQGLWDETLTLNNDFEYFTRLLLGCSEILYCPNAKLHYRSNLSGSLSQKRGEMYAASHLRALLEGTSLLLDRCATPSAKAACANILQAFEYKYYPDHPDLRARARARVAELGGSTLHPDGPPGFQRLRSVVGWKLARRAQRFAEAHRLNRAGRATENRRRE